VSATIARDAREALEGRAPQAFAPARTVRRRLHVTSLVADVAVALVCYELAIIIFNWFHHYELRFMTDSFDWGLPFGVLALVGTYLWMGLYKLEAYVSRPLHLLAVARGTVVAMVITAFVAFAFKAPIVTESRLTLFTIFTIFFVVDAAVRLWLLDDLYKADVRARHGGTVVIGDGADTSHIVGRCRELRGFAPVKTLEPLDKRRNGYDAEPALLRALAAAEPAPRQVLLVAGALGHKAALDLIAAAHARGSEVYVVGRIVGPMDTTRMLLRLFEMPVMRVRGVPRAGAHLPLVKRAFDVVTSAAALIVLAPLFATIAVLIKHDSRGPVFYRQTRVGARGRTFEFLKFRSMTVGNDPGEHRDYVTRLIECGGEGAGAADDPALCALDEWGRPVYKLAADVRVTRVGHFLRKYSLDELPQFWNVLRGDMSMVGPRPALEYEVEAYKPWHRMRLEVTPGVSGLWQVAGRSRVGFDEMVFQDVIYGYNQSVLTDVNLCLRTVPAMFMGRGAT